MLHREGLFVWWRVAYCKLDQFSKFMYSKFIDAISVVILDVVRFSC